MMNLISKMLVVTGVCVLTCVVGGAPVNAQQSPSPPVDKNAVVLIPGVLTGPGTMGPRGFKRLCTPRSVGLYEWQMRWIERLVRPTEAQRAALNDLQSAEQGNRDDVEGMQDGSAHDDESRVADDGQPARDNVSGREDPATGIRRVLRLAG
jgi:hypothetical protein